MFVCCECCVLSGRGLCDETFTRPEESYRLWCVFVCDLETSRLRSPWPALDRSGGGGGGGRGGGGGGGGAWSRLLESMKEKFKKARCMFLRNVGAEWEQHTSAPRTIQSDKSPPRKPANLQAIVCVFATTPVTL
jgi:hypothetical protein